jgi:hypothetical protein
MNVEIGTEDEQFPRKEIHKGDFSCSAKDKTNIQQNLDKSIRLVSQL